MGQTPRVQLASGLDSGGCGAGAVCHFIVEVPTSVSGQATSDKQRSNKRLAFQLALVAVLFGGFGFALVPLYDVICNVTGLNGRTNSVAAVVNKNTQIDTSRWVKVEFLSHTMPGVGLDFAPEQFSMRVHPGDVIHTTYVVKNTTDEVFVGQAIPSVTPATAAPHFQKIECFCFSQQKFLPREVRSMPVVFVVSPELNRDMGTVTLSYTFFEVPKA